MLEVHHIRPFHTDPQLELNGANLITLCNAKYCHFENGHLGNFRELWDLEIRGHAAEHRRYVEIAKRRDLRD